MGILRNQRHELFCQEYLKSGNASEAFRMAYPHSVRWKPETVHSKASNLLKAGKVQTRVEELQREQQKRCAITKDRLLGELGKIAFSSIADMHNTWIERKDFEQLTPDQKASIKSISTKMMKKNIGTADNPEIVDVEYVKIELHDKLKAIERICKMLGFDEPIEITGKDGKDLFASKTDDELLDIVNDFKRKLD